MLPRVAWQGREVLLGKHKPRCPWLWPHHSCPCSVLTWPLLSSLRLCSVCLLQGHKSLGSGSVLIQADSLLETRHLPTPVKTLFPSKATFPGSRGEDLALGWGSVGRDCSPVMPAGHVWGIKSGPLGMHICLFSNRGLSRAAELCLRKEAGG